MHGAPALPPPLRSVFDFGRVEGLAPGGTRLLSFALDPAGRALIDGDGVWFNPAGSFSVSCEAGSVAKTELATLTVA